MIAYRLAARPDIRVLLLEAGGADDDPAIARLPVTSLLLELRAHATRVRIESGRGRRGVPAERRAENGTNR